ncbi:afadin- and alpha-actinin-binding protein A-like [Lytechinus variegatus]|uniref:afadin- and alpha-actinin-binding protein A-like n=1 Tax=Lytechinus variegatus TaxID=7654 RepID=UPI001BB20E5B|nr:afadin- and alpha-actinin-binding protein A-like [Lytechinus variegatus]
MMAGWELANSMVLTPHSDPRRLSFDHDEFISKYTTQSFHYHPTSPRNPHGYTPSPQRPSNGEGSGGGPSFCTKDNIDQCVSYLDQELTALGFPPLFIKPSTSSKDRSKPEQFDLVQLVNCAYELIQRHQRSMKKHEDLETKQMRTSSDLEHLQTNHSRLKEQHEQIQRENISQGERERQLTLQLKSSQSKLKSQKDEMRKLEGILKHRDVQFKHDLKKKEREVNRLKERIHQLLVDKNQERRIGMDILNSLQRTDGKRGTWKTDKSGIKHEEDMYRVIITNYEERQKEVMMENQVLRESLSNMQQELVNLLNRQAGEGGGGVGGGTPNNRQGYISDSEYGDTRSIDSSISELSTGHFQMPFEMVREGIETSLRQKWQKLRDHIQQIEKENRENQEGGGGGSSKDGTGSTGDEGKGGGGGGGGSSGPKDAEIENLRRKLEAYHDIIVQQEQVLQAVQETGMDGDFLGFIRESTLLDEKENLATEQNRLYGMKHNFEKEQRNFTDAAIRLGEERKKFEEERSAFLQEQLMLTPLSSHHAPLLRPPRSINKATSPSLNPTSQQPLNQSPSPPHHTPSGSQKRVQTPSTVELYRALKLLPEGGKYLNVSRESIHSIGSQSLLSDSELSCHSGVSTPRSSKAPSIIAGRPLSSQSGHSSHGSTDSLNKVGTKSRRTEEHKHNLRKTMAHRQRRADKGAHKK